MLAVTPLVADEKPLWVASTRWPRHRPRRQHRRLVTAGMYLVSERVRRLSRPPTSGG